MKTNRLGVKLAMWCVVVLGCGLACAGNAWGDTNAEQSAQERQARSLPDKVGDAGDLDRITFAGLHTFTRQQIRRALARKPSYLLAAHPQAKMAVFLDALRAMVESGYQAAGFPEVTADVHYDELTSSVGVKVTEGPRFRAGRIEVVGAKSIDVGNLVKWFTIPGGGVKTAEPPKTASASNDAGGTGSDREWSFRASSSIELNPRTGVLQTPGKANRPDDPLWVAGEPADFSYTWEKGAVEQVEACLAEQGFFFPKSKVEIRRNADTNTADLWITILQEGPPGVVDEIKVTGMKRDSAEDITHFLGLRSGMKINAEGLTAAREKLRNCGRFWDFDIEPEFVATDRILSEHVNLDVEVKEQDGVPKLDQPLSPVQEALLKLCKWIGEFPERDEDIQITVTNTEAIPFAVEFILSPKHGILLNAESLSERSPVAEGCLLTRETIEFCAWASGKKLAASRGDCRGSFFLRVLSDKSGGSNHFNLSAGAGFGGNGPAPYTGAGSPLDYDIQLAPAAFLELISREGGGCRIEGSTLVATNGAFTLRADAATGRIIGVDEGTNLPGVRIVFGSPAFESAASNFTRRAASLTNQYTPGRGPSSFLALATTELARCWLASPLNSNMDLTQSARVADAISKLIGPELFSPMDRLFGDQSSNSFAVPFDEFDAAIARNNLMAFGLTLAFDYGGELFPKNSWPWTVAREAAFVTMNEGRYTGLELDRLYRSKDTGPIGCLAISRLLAMAGQPDAKTFAQIGFMRLDSDDFLRDCHLFLNGESGLAREFARVAGILRTLPEEDIAALAAVLPKPEAGLLRDSWTALRAAPDAAPGRVLGPALAKYWEESLRVKVRDSLLRPARG